MLAKELQSVCCLKHIYREAVRRLWGFYLKIIWRNFKLQLYREKGKVK